MSMYYHAARPATTNATPSTENLTDLQLITGTGFDCAISCVSINARSPSGTSLAGAAINFRRYATAGSGGSALAGIGKANPNFPTNTTTIKTGSTTGTTGTLQRTVGCAAPGGAGGWMAIERDDAMRLVSGGAANGNLETATIAGLASIVLDYTIDFGED